MPQKSSALLLTKKINKAANIAVKHKAAVLDVTTILKDLVGEIPEDTDYDYPNTLLGLSLDDGVQMSCMDVVELLKWMHRMNDGEEYDGYLKRTHRNESLADGE
jgi:hypothetical protein